MAMVSEVFEERPRLISKVSWGALFAGFFFGVALLFLLLSLGAAVGFTRFDPRSGDSWQNLGVGLGIWGGIASILAMFVAAWVTVRLSAAVDGTSGALHGAALWGFNFAAISWLALMVFTGAVHTTASVAKGAAGVAGAGISKVSGEGILDSDALANQANAWLRQQGKPEVPPDQMKAAFGEMANRAMDRIRAGQGPISERVSNAVDRNLIVGSLANKTNLTRQDAQQLAGQIEGSVRDGVSSAQEKISGMVQEVGAKAATVSKAGAWASFFASLLTLAAAIVGGALGVPPERRHLRTRRVIASEPTRPLTPQEA